MPDQPLCGRRSSGLISGSPSLPRFSFCAPSCIASVPKNPQRVVVAQFARTASSAISRSKQPPRCPSATSFCPAGRLIKDHRRARAGPSRRHPWRALRRRSRVVRRASPSGSPTSRPARRRAHRPNAARSKACSPGGMRRGSGFVPTPSGFTYMAMWLSADNHCLVRGVCSPAFALSCPRTTKAETASGLSVCKFVTNRVLL